MRARKLPVIAGGTTGLPDAQHAGRRIECRTGAEALGAFAAYVGRFPTVKTFFAEAIFDLDHFTRRFRARLYAFLPERVHYLNNRAGLGSRQEIRLPE